MRHSLLTFALAVILAVCTPASQAETVVDDITYSSLGLNPGAGLTQFFGRRINSEATYSGLVTLNNKGVIQISRNDQAGIFTSASGGTIKSISIVFDSSTVEGHAVQLFVNRSPYSSVSDMSSTATQGLELTPLMFNPSDGIGHIYEAEVPEGYNYLLLASMTGRVYIEKITVTWDNGSGIEEVPIGVDTATPAVYYNLFGQAVSSPTTGVYLRVVGNDVSKILIK